MCFVTTYLAFVRVRLKKLLTYLLTFVCHDCNKTIKRWTRFTLHCSGEPFACSDCKNARLRGNDKLHFQCLLALCLYRDTAVFLVSFIISSTSSYTHKRLYIYNYWQKLLLIGHCREDTNANSLLSIPNMHIIQILGYNIRWLYRDNRYCCCPQ